MRALTLKYSLHFYPLNRIWSCEPPKLAGAWAMLSSWTSQRKSKYFLLGTQSTNSSPKILSPWLLYLRLELNCLFPLFLLYSDISCCCLEILFYFSTAFRLFLFVLLFFKKSYFFYLFKIIIKLHHLLLLFHLSKILPCTPPHTHTLY